jgi:site-specific DNA recombinase
VSTEEQKRNGWNLEADRERIQEIAEAEGWDLVTVYDDAGRQGDDPDRPGFNAMIAELDRFDVIVLRSLDRLSRDTFLYALATRAIRAAHVEVHTFNGPVDLDTPEGELASNVLAAIARFEKRQIGVRVKQAVRARAKAGHAHGGPRPYGYRWSAEGLVVDPIEAEVVRRMFDDTINGVSQRQLARQLIAEGVRTVRGGPWGQATVGRILMNPIYKGLIRLQRQEYDGEHEPIVTVDVWDRANAVRASSVRRKGGRWPKGSHLLTKGILRCGRCGCAMTPRTDPGRKNYEVYQCHGRLTRGPEFCPQGTIRRHLVDEALLADLTAHWLDLDETRRRMEQRQNADLAIAREAVAQSEREAQKAADALARIERDYIDDTITAEQWTRLEATLVGERDGAASALERAQDHAHGVEQAGAVVDAEQALLTHLAAIRKAVAEGIEHSPDLNALRQTIAQLFDRVELMPAPLIDSMARPDGVYLLPFLSPMFPERAVLPITDHNTFVT